MRKLTDFAINSIIDELEERYEEAKKAYEADTTNLANQAAFFVYLQVNEIIEDRIDL